MNKAADIAADLPADIQGAEGRFRVEGALGYATVPALLSRSAQVLQGPGPWTIDLGGVGQVDSAGLALLMRWLRLAAASGTTVRFENMPRQMRSIAEVSGLDQLLRTD